MGKKNKKLKRCPFCGGKVKVVNRPWFNKQASYEIFHEDTFKAIRKQCPSEIGGYLAEKDAIEQWNKRAG